MLENKYKVTESGCWEWQGCTNASGYGTIRRNQKTQLAHRYFYINLKGVIPEGLQLDHLCRVRNCVNPEHLEPVTKAENQRRGYILKTHCKQGHEYTPENTIKRSDNNGRRCKTCVKIKERRRYVSNRYRG